MQLPDQRLRQIINDSSSLIEHYGSDILNSNAKLPLHPSKILRWEQQLSGTGQASYTKRLDGLRKWPEYIMHKIRHLQHLSGTLEGWPRFVQKALESYDNRDDQNNRPTSRPYGRIMMPFATAVLSAIQTESHIASMCTEACLGEIMDEVLHTLLDLSELAIYAYHQANYPGLSEPQFVHQLLRTGYLDFLCAYPSLARLLGAHCLDMISGYILLFNRLENDLHDIVQTFGIPDPGDTLLSISGGYNLPHTAEGPVRRIAFQSGDAVFYKPRPGDADVLYNALCDWVNTLLGEEELVPLQSLSRNGYCWQREITNTPLSQSHQLSRYYKRAGFLIALTQILGSSDYHLENIIAGGEFPVPVDNETILSHNCSLRHSHQVTSRNPFTRSFLIPQDDKITHISSVPSGIFGNKYVLKHTAVVMDKQGLPAIVEEPYIRYGRNKPRYQGTFAIPSDYIEEMASGYEKMLRLIHDNTTGFETLVQQQTMDYAMPVRLVLRESKWYWEMREELRKPVNLKLGIDRSITLDKLCASFAGHLDNPIVLSFLQAEIDALDTMYVPAFYLPANYQHLPDRGITIIERNAKSLLQDNLARLTESMNIRAWTAEMRNVLSGIHSNANR